MGIGYREGGKEFPFLFCTKTNIFGYFNPALPSMLDFYPMPSKESPILTRELLYTAITRAKKKVELWCPEILIDSTLNKEVMRHSGLADRLKRMCEK